jgi:hypothetical protein
MSTVRSVELSASVLAQVVRPHVAVIAVPGIVQGCGAALTITIAFSVAAQGEHDRLSTRRCSDTLRADGQPDASTVASAIASCSGGPASTDLASTAPGAVRR